MVIPAGQTSGVLTLTPLNDAQIEGNETVIVSIASVSGGTENGSQQVTAILVDDEGTLTLAGTNGDDVIAVLFNPLPTFSVNINGQLQFFNVATIGVVNFDGLGGNDTLVLQTGSGIDSVMLSPLAATVSSATYSFSGMNIEKKYIFAGANDTATFSDSAADDVFVALPAYSVMYGSAYLSQVIDTAHVTATATAGGSDTALLYDSAGNDVFVADTDSGDMTGSGIELHASGFDANYGYSYAGGNDTATLQDSSGNDIYTGVQGYCTLYGPGFANGAINFASPLAIASDGSDAAVFYDSAANDTFTGSPNQSQFVTGSVTNRIQNFDNTYVFAFGGGVDTANLDGSNQDDIFSGNALNASLFRTDIYVLQVLNFEQVNAQLSSTSGTDIAELIDGVGNDTLNASGSTAEITYAAGNRIKVAAFDFVFAKNQNGGTNTKQVVNPLAFQLALIGDWA